MAHPFEVNSSFLYLENVCIYLHAINFPLTKGKKKIQTHQVLLSISLFMLSVTPAS